MHTRLFIEVIFARRAFRGQPGNNRDLAPVSWQTRKAV
jgi:hypothetical protein